MLMKKYIAIIILISLSNTLFGMEYPEQPGREKQPSREKIQPPREKKPVHITREQELRKTFNVTIQGITNRTSRNLFLSIPATKELYAIPTYRDPKVIKPTLLGVPLVFNETKKRVVNPEELRKKDPAVRYEYNYLGRAYISKKGMVYDEKTGKRKIIYSRVAEIAVLVTLTEQPNKRLKVDALAVLSPYAPKGIEPIGLPYQISESIDPSKDKVDLLLNIDLIDSTIAGPGQAPVPGNVASSTLEWVAGSIRTQTPLIPQRPESREGKYENNE